MEFSQAGPAPATSTSVPSSGQVTRAGARCRVETAGDMEHGDTVIIVILDTDSEPGPEHGNQATCSCQHGEAAGRSGGRSLPGQDSRDLA